MTRILLNAGSGSSFFTGLKSNRPFGSVFAFTRFGFYIYSGVRFQPNRNYVSNDDVQTPFELAESIVDYFSPSGHILEPCAGDGHFLRYLPDAEWCEIKQGRFFVLPGASGLDRY